MQDSEKRTLPYLPRNYEACNSLQNIDCFKGFLLPSLCIIRKSNYLETKALKWFGKKKHATFWFWHHGRRSVSHEIILVLKCFFLKTLVQLECCIFSCTNSKSYSPERRWMAKTTVCVCICWQCIAKLKRFL